MVMAALTGAGMHHLIARNTRNLPSCESIDCVKGSSTVQLHRLRRPVHTSDDELMMEESSSLSACATTSLVSSREETRLRPARTPECTLLPAG